MASEAQIKANQENAKLGGRPESEASVIKRKFRDALAKKIEAESEEWMGAIKDAALGHYVEVKQADGTIKVYKKSPDAGAWQKGMDRAFGSPEQLIDHQNDGGKFEPGSVSPAALALTKKYEEEIKRTLSE